MGSRSVTCWFAAAGGETSTRTAAGAGGDPADGMKAGFAIAGCSTNAAVFEATSGRSVGGDPSATVRTTWTVFGPARSPGGRVTRMRPALRTEDGATGLPTPLKRTPVADPSRFWP